MQIQSFVMIQFITVSLFVRKSCAKRENENEFELLLAAWCWTDLNGRVCLCVCVECYCHIAFSTCVFVLFSSSAACLPRGNSTNVVALWRNRKKLFHFRRFGRVTVCWAKHIISASCRQYFLFEVWIILSLVSHCLIVFARKRIILVGEGWSRRKNNERTNDTRKNTNDSPLDADPRTEFSDDDDCYRRFNQIIQFFCKTSSTRSLRIIFSFLEQGTNA